MSNDLWQRFRKSRLGMASLVILALMYVTAIFAGFIGPYSPTKQNLAKPFHPPTGFVVKNFWIHVPVYQNVDPAIAAYERVPGQTLPLRLFHDGRLFGVDSDNPQDRVYLLGSDSTGRCVFSRLLHGARVSLSIGLVGITITLTIGFLVGSFSGYMGGITDNISMRLVEFLIAVPSLYLLLALRGVLADRLGSENMYFVIVIALALINWAPTARIIRGMALSLRQRQFVLAAETLGQSKANILLKHLLPNLASYLLVSATLSIPNYILGEAALSFLGIGLQEPDASWGLMLSGAQSMKVFQLNFWWLLTPGFAIFLAVITFNILGDILRDIIDPRTKNLNP